MSSRVELATITRMCLRKKPIHSAGRYFCNKDKGVRS